MKILYFGSGAFGIPTLAHLAHSHTLLGIVTQPDRPAGRGGRLTPTPVAQWAAEHAPGVPIFKPEKVNAPDVVAQIRDLGGPDRAEAWVVIAFGQKLGKTLLDGVFAINLHASLLPRWRGAAPINAAILAGDTETGNSVITLADRMDAGLILGQSRRPIDPLTTAGELHDLLAADGPALVEQVLAAHDSARRGGTPIPTITQDESLVTIAPKLTKASGHLDWTARDADAARRLIHAMTPWPGVTVVLHGSPLKLLRARTIDGAAADLPPGSILDPAAGTVACAGGTMLSLLDVQPAGKRPMSWGDFARGRTIRRGDMLAPEARSSC